MGGSGGLRRHRYAFAALVAALVVVGLGQPVSAAPARGAGVPSLASLVNPPLSGFQPVGPVRLLDTRVGAPVGPGQTRQLTVVGGSTGIPTTGVGSVALNITTTSGTAGGYVTVWPTGQAAMPSTSTVNFGLNTTVPNTIVVGVGTGGSINIYNAIGTVHVVVDATGWFPTGSGVTPIAPKRMLDTRATAPVGPGGTRSVQVAGGTTGIPADAVAVAANVTAVGSSAASFVTVYPAGKTRPGTSSLNFGAATTVANALFATVGAGGQISLYNAVGTVNLIVDVTGYLSPTSGYVALPVPVRVADTRDAGYQRWGWTYDPGGFVGANPAEFTVLSSLSGTNPALPVGPAAAVLNITATQATGAAPLQVWPGGGTRPPTSSLNAVPGVDVANGAIMRTPDGVLDAGTFPDLYMHVIIDVSGYFPLDGIGLIYPSDQIRDMSLGVDRIGVVFCLQPGNTVDRALAVANLNAQIAPFYKTISGDRYNQVFVDAGVVNLASTDIDCLGKLAGAVPASAGFNAALGIKAWQNSATFASGLAGPGNGTSTSFPANGRDGETSASSVIAYGAPAPPIYSVAAHELGHMLDWTHSHLAGAGDYTNPMDLMSGHPSGTSVAAQYLPFNTVAVNRLRVGWIDPSQVRVHAGGTVSYTIAPPGVAGVQMVVVRNGPVAGGPSRFLTLDARVRSGPDIAIDAEGIEVMMVQDDANASGISGKVAPAFGAANTAQHVITAGTSKTLTSTAGNVTITVGAKAADGSFPVTVTGQYYDPGVMAGSNDPGAITPSGTPEDVLLPFSISR